MQKSQVRPIQTAKKEAMKQSSNFQTIPRIFGPLQLGWADAVPPQVLPKIQHPLDALIKFGNIFGGVHYKLMIIAHILSYIH